MTNDRTQLWLTNRQVTLLHEAVLELKSAHERHQALRGTSAWAERGVLGDIEVLDEMLQVLVAREQDA